VLYAVASRARARRIGSRTDLRGVADLAARANLSERQFSRRFRAVTGQSPVEWLVGQRIAASLAYLESGDEPVEQVAALVGFSNPVTFRED
jgi:AraC family transcriptional activator FtrA